MRIVGALFALGLAACSSSTTLDGGFTGCFRATDCPAGSSCIAAACVPSTPCTTTRMCPGLICDPRLGTCVECITTTDCTGGMICRSSVCGAAPRSCHSDRDCTPIGLVCDVADAVCAECNAAVDCDPGSYCGADHTCTADTCTPGATRCAGAYVATCLDDGSDFGLPTPCPSGMCAANACVPAMDGGTRDAGVDAGHDSGADASARDAGIDTGTPVDAGTDAAPFTLYHGWACPIAGCLTGSYDTTAPSALGGSYPFNAGDSNACRAWKLAATVCTTAPTTYLDPSANWTCPASGGFTDPTFGTYCASPTTQYACSTCPGACNATCIYTPLSLRNCMGTEVAQM